MKTIRIKKGFTLVELLAAPAIAPQERREARKAFTLVELLVVISIMALLMGILLPVLGKAQERGRIASSIGNASQISKGIMLFALDNRNRLPGYSGGETFAVNELNDDKTPSKEDSPMDYIRDEKVFRSPSDRGSDLAGMAADHCFEDIGISYAYPAQTTLSVQSIEDATGGTYRMTSIDNSTAKVLVFEPGLAVNQANLKSRSKDRWYSSKNRAVAGFLDGHAEMIKGNSNSVDVANGYY